MEIITQIQERLHRLQTRGPGFASQVFRLVRTLVEDPVWRIQFTLCRTMAFDEAGMASSRQPLYNLTVHLLGPTEPDTPEKYAYIELYGHDDGLVSPVTYSVPFCDRRAVFMLPARRLKTLYKIELVSLVDGSLQRIPVTSSLDTTEPAFTTRGTAETTWEYTTQAFGDDVILTEVRVMSDRVREEDDNILLETPYGVKRWSMIRTALEQRETLVTALEEAVRQLQSFLPAKFRPYGDACFRYVTGGVETWNCQCAICCARRVIADVRRYV